MWEVEPGVKDSPLEPVDDRGHIQFKAERNLTPRFKMLTCVGTGTFGKVIMCWDRVERVVVAVKVLRSVEKYAMAGRNEIAVLTTMMNHDKGAHWPFLRLKGWFEYSGMGESRHISMVFDMLGPSLYETMLRNWSAPFHVVDIRGYIRQVLQSLAYMHGLGIVHTDVKPENLLHTKVGYATKARGGNAVANGVGNGSGGNEAGKGDDGPEAEDGQRPKKKARSTANRKPLAAYLPSDGKIIMCDFGSAAFEDGVHAKTVSTRNYRAPEIILQVGWSVEVDLWSVGCLIMEMVTGATFFSTSCDKEHLAMITRVVGRPIPQHIAELHHRRVPNSELLEAGGAAVRDVAQRQQLLNKNLLDRYFVLKVNESLMAASQETKDLKNLVKKLLQWDPKARGTAAEALEHPFFTRNS